MAARRGLSLLGAVIALLVAGVGAVWLWFGLASGQSPAHLASAAMVVLIALTFAARCLVHLLGSLSREPAGAVELTGAEDVADPLLHMLRDDSGGGTRAPQGVACPWCEQPLRRVVERCPGCGQAL